MSSEKSVLKTDHNVIFDMRFKTLNKNAQKVISITPPPLYVRALFTLILIQVFKTRHRIPGALP